MPSERSPVIDSSWYARPVAAVLGPARAGLRPNATTVAALSVFFASAVFYGVCLYPGVGGGINPGDSAKFQVLGHTPILVHGPGYPLILMIGAGVRALALPLPPWWTITFAISVVPGAIANAFGFLIMRRLVDSMPFALGGTLVLATTQLMALQATEAEVYALNIAFVLAILYLLIRFIETRRLIYFLAACASYAASFGDHLMMISMLPVFVAITTIYRDIILRRHVVITVLVFILLGASQYLYVAYAAYDPRTAYSEYMPLPPTVAELVRYILAFYFGDLFGTGLQSPRQLQELGGTLWSAHPWVSAPLIAIGLLLFACAWPRRDARWWAVALVFGTALSFVPFMLWYGAGDIRAFHLPVLAPALLGAMASIGWSLRQRPQLRRAAAALLLLFGTVRAADTAVALTTREAPLAKVKPLIWELMSHPHPAQPFIALTYPPRFAALYFNQNGELPGPASYRLQWRTIFDLPKLASIGGFVIGRDGHDFIAMIEHERPGMACSTENVPLRQDYQWPAFSFQCDLQEGGPGQGKPSSG